MSRQGTLKFENCGIPKPMFICLKSGLVAAEMVREGGYGFGQGLYCLAVPCARGCAVASPQSQYLFQPIFRCQFSRVRIFFKPFAGFQFFEFLKKSQTAA
jgi:hypothetical protein